MSTNNSDAPVPDIEAALSALHEHDDKAGFLQALAAGDVVLPQLEPVDSEGGVPLPFIEEQGTRYVVAFSSQQRLDDSGFDVPGSITVGGAELGSLWPVDEDLWLALNPGCEQSVAVPPDAMRSLPALVGP